MADRIKWLHTAGGCLMAFVFSAAAWTAAMALFGFFPFGSKTILITDMGSQYVAYHEALYEMIHEGDSLLFTWNTGMGMNFLGIIAYYLAAVSAVLAHRRHPVYFIGKDCRFRPDLFAVSA